MYLLVCMYTCCLCIEFMYVGVHMYVFMSMFLKVRCAGYSILASLYVSGERGLVEKLTCEWWTLSGRCGLWGACMSVGGDWREWRLVRQQVRGSSERCRECPVLTVGAVCVCVCTRHCWFWWH